MNKLRQGNSNINDVLQKTKVRLNMYTRSLMHVLKPIISILLQHKFNIGLIIQVGTVRIGEFDGPDPDRGPPFERRLE